MTRQEFKRLRHTYRYYNRYCGKGWEENQRSGWLLGYTFSKEELEFMKQVTMTQATKKQVKRRNRCRVLAVGKAVGLEVAGPGVTIWTLLDDKTVGLWRDDVDVDKVEVSIQ